MSRSQAKHSRINAKWTKLCYVVKNVTPVHVDAVTPVVFIYMAQFSHMVFCPRNESRWQSETESSRSLFGQHRALAREYACLRQLCRGR
jgi:hypothetical protein